MAVTMEEQTGAVPAAVPKSVTILGSTGSVGCQTIDLLRRNISDYSIVALTANTNVELLSEQALVLKPQLVVIGDENRLSLIHI